MFNAQSTAKVISGWPTTQDIHNIRNRLNQQENAARSDEELLIDQFENILKEDPRASIVVEASSDKTLQLLLIITSEMKQTYI